MRKQVVRPNQKSKNIIGIFIISIFMTLPLMGEELFQNPTNSLKYPTLFEFRPRSDDANFSFKWYDGQNRAHHSWTTTNLLNFHLTRNINPPTKQLLETSASRLPDKENQMSTLIAHNAVQIGDKTTGLPEKTRIILSEKVVVDSLFKMVRGCHKENIGSFSTDGARLVQMYIKYWAKTNPQQLSVVLKSLLNQVSSKNNTLAPYQIGAMLGVMLSGANNYALSIQERDTNKSFCINTASSLTWGATSFIGLFSFLKTVTQVVLGGVSALGIVGTTSAWSYLNPIRDFRNYVNMAKGEILNKLSIRQEETTIASEKQRIQQQMNDINLYITITLNYNGHNG